MQLASFIRAMKFAAAAMSAATLLIGAATPSHAQAKAKAAAPESTTGTVRLHIVKAGFIVGVGGGSGTLNFRGHNYPLSVSGVGIGSLGVAAVDLRGTASNLTSPAAIAGSFGGAGAGGTFVGGGQVATLQNGNGVVLQLSGAQAGFQISLGLAGMNIALAR
jgi:hypothetical protein